MSWKQKQAADLSIQQAQGQLLRFGRGYPAGRFCICVTSVLILGSLVGCSTLAERLGFRVRLDKVPVAAVSASLVHRRYGFGIRVLGPGQSAALVITATTGDGKQLATVGAGKGKVAFNNYIIAATVVTVSKRGIVSLPADPRLSEGSTPHLHITPSAYPDVAGDLDIPVVYDIPYLADFSGANGTNGIDGYTGLDGSAGTDGIPGSVDPTTGLSGTSGPGGNGSDGGNGGDGSDGQAGSPGGNVTVWVRLKGGEKPLLQIKLVSVLREMLYLVDPNGGSLKILADGGAGGRGGTGGRGGRGGPGGIGSPDGLGGHDGLSGRDGLVGRDGAAGTIELSVDPEAKPFMSCITWSNHSGAGRPGLPPVVKVEPVEPLW